MGLNLFTVKWPNQSGFGCHFTGARIRIVEIPNHGAFPSSGPPNRVPYRTGTPTPRTIGILKTQKTIVFWELLKNPTPKDGAGYRGCRLLAMWSPLANLGNNHRVAPETSWRLRTRRETKGRTDFTEIPPPGGVAPSAPQPQNPRESNHGESGNGGPFWGLNRKSAKWPNHRGFGSHFTWIWDRITVLPIHGTFPRSGPPNRAPYRTGTPTPSPTQDLENPKDYRLLGKKGGGEQGGEEGGVRGEGVG